MWKEIWKALKVTDILAEMVTQFAEMLDAGQWMFEQASEVLMRSCDWAASADALYSRDRTINKIERTIREQIVTTLSVGPQSNLNACLVLMSVVKDAERIGDYCKNIFEVGKFYRRDYTHPEYAQPLTEIRNKVLPLFEQAKKAFVQADRQEAYAVLNIAGGVSKECDLLIRQLLSVHDQLAPDEAVAYVLLARFYKRVTAHLANIATSVVSPVPMLDFRHEQDDSTAT